MDSTTTARLNGTFVSDPGGGAVACRDCKILFQVVKFGDLNQQGFASNIFFIVNYTTNNMILTITRPTLNLPMLAMETIIGPTWQAYMIRSIPMDSLQLQLSE
uniref:Uncharacterized protein n=5 Tax=Oryza TaxID=4527 RepID=Q10RV2_ORYSJ|nr:hypothetical protein LOC_Os03g05150 [Oryza sativa Japonica Group]